MKKALLSFISISAILLSGCASTSQPTSKVGIVNGKYAMQTTLNSNNKGKKVRIAEGQSYHCIKNFNNNTPRIEFDLKSNKIGEPMVVYNEKLNGKPAKGLFTTSGRDTSKFEREDDGSFREKRKGGNRMKILPEGKGQIALFITAANKGVILQCTQITNNIYSHTRYLTKDEISAYQHNQQIAVQQRAINNANYNATMDRIQARNAQTNYNTQQMLNRMNTSNQSTNSIINPSNNKFYMHSDGTSTRKVGNTYYHSNGTTTTAY